MRHHNLGRFRKAILQAGLIIIGLSVFFGIAGEIVFGSSPNVILIAETMLLFAVAVLVVGAVMPRGKGEKWGSMFPMVGYDRGYDNMVVRGPWQRRLDEMDEQQKHRRKKP